MCVHAASFLSIHYDPKHACRRPEHRFGSKPCRKHTIRLRWTSGTDYPLQAGVLSRNWSERAPACFGALHGTISYLERRVVVSLDYIALMWNWPKNLMIYNGGKTAALTFAPVIYQHTPKIPKKDRTKTSQNFLIFPSAAFKRRKRHFKVRCKIPENGIQMFL